MKGISKQPSYWNCGRMRKPFETPLAVWFGLPDSESGHSELRIILDPPALKHRAVVFSDRKPFSDIALETALK